MSSNVDVPYTRRNVSVLSQRSNNNSSARQRTPQPINESMVRERLSVNLPDSFHYLNNTLPMGRRRHHRHNNNPRRHRSSSSSSSSTESSGSSAENVVIHGGNESVTVAQDAHPVPPAAQISHDDVALPTERRSRLRSSASSRHSSADSNSNDNDHRHHHSSDSSDSDSSDASEDHCEDDYNFYARLVKLNRTNSNPAATPTAGGGGGYAAPLVAQCCDTVRGTVEMLQQLHLATGETQSSDQFFWLDLHGVPPPLPGTPEWATRPRRWQRRQLAALRSNGNLTSAGTGETARRLPEVEMSALWTALGLQKSSVEALTTVCRQRQADPRPDRTSLDDIYEEEMVDLSYPDDRIVQVEPLPGIAAATANADPPTSPTRTNTKTPSAAAAPAGNGQRAGNASAAAHLNATHYVVMELATLLTSVPATTSSISASAWSSNLLTNVGSATFENEPLNDLVWTENMGRNVHAFSAGYRPGGGRFGRNGGSGRHAGNARDGRQLTQSTFYSGELPVTPLITATYVICFPGGCVTWCPGSTLGLVSAERRERRHAAAQQRRRRHRQRTDSSDSDTSHQENDTRRANLSSRGTAQPNRNTTNNANNANHNSNSSSTDSEDLDDDEGLAVQYVKSWEQLQASVFHRLRHMASHKGPNTAVGGAVPVSGAHRAHSAGGSAPVMCTSGFVALLLSAVCYAYLPHTTTVLSEVDAIDSMLPLVGLNVESDQADALRRVLLLRRRLAVHRRLLFQKIRLLEALDKPALHTLARFVRTVKEPSWVLRLAYASTKGTATTTTNSEGPRHDSDTDSLSVTTTPNPYDPHNHRNTSTIGMGAADTAVPMVHFIDGDAEEVPWSMRTAEQNYGGGYADAAERSINNNSNSNNISTTCFPSVAGEHRWNRKGGGYGYGSRGQLRRITEPPSLNAIHKGVSNVLRNLETARTVLGNTTLIYTSAVNYNNNRSSESSDYFALICQYMLLIVLPLNIVASQWGMNCAVPFMNVKGTAPFWGIVSIMIVLAIAGLAVPLYAYRTGKMNMIS